MAVKRGEIPILLAETGLTGGDDQIKLVQIQIVIEIGGATLRDNQLYIRILLLKSDSDIRQNGISSKRRQTDLNIISVQLSG